MFKKAISLLLSLMLIVTSLSVTIFSVSAADGSTYKVAGSDELTGDGPIWQPSAEASPSNVMTAKGDGTYEKVYTDVAVKDGYSLKIVENTAEGDFNWIGVGGVGEDAVNFVFNVTSVCDVTVTFDPATNKINVTGTGVVVPTDLDVKSVTAVGNAEEGDAFLNGMTWKQDAAVNHMTEVAPNVYEITYTGVETLEEFAEVENEFKFAINDAWADSFGGAFEGFGVESDAVYNGDNLKVCFPVGVCDVTLKLDLSNFDFATKKGAKFTVSAVKQGEEPTEATTVAPTTEAPTTEAPTTAAPTTAGGKLNVKATSNYFPEQTVTLSEDEEYVTVTYFIESKKNLLNIEWDLEYDASVLQFDPSVNINTEKECINLMPNVGEALVWNDNTTGNEGKISGNASSLNLFKIKNRVAPLVTATFKVIGSGDTTVNLYVHIMGLSELNSSLQYDEANDEYVIDGGKIQDTATKPVVTTVPHAGLFDPTATNPSGEETTAAPETTVAPTTAEPTTAEPTTVEPTTAEPTTVEPTTAEPTTVEPTTAEPTTVEPTTAEPTTAEPTTAEPTTAEPTTAEPTTAEPTTEAPKGLYVTGTSNYFPEYTQFVAEGQEYVTVSYFLQSEKNMLNTEWALSYDTSVLQFDIDANMNATGNGYNIMPQCEDAVIGFPRDGVIKGNCSRLNLYKMGPDRYTYVTVTFKVIGTGSTAVDLFVNVLGVSKVGPPDFTTIDSEEEYPVDGGVPQEVNVKVVPSTVVYAGKYVPDVTADPSAPTAPETTVAPETTEAPTTVAPTTVAPTTEAPTTVAPTTEAPTTAPVSSLEIKATSNIAPEKTYTWTAADGTELVTVTYYLNSDKKLLNTQWTLKYDNTLLEVIPENNIGGFMPYIVDGADYNTSVEGVIIGNASSLNLYDLSKAPAQEFVQVTFKVKGTGSTVVDLEVSDLGLSEINPETGKSDESKEVVIIANSQTVGDIQLITTDTTVKPGTGVVVDPTVEPTTVEPTTVEPTTVEPTTVEPTTVEPTTVEPTTAPATEEPTTAPATEEPTTAPATEEPTTAPATEEPTTAPATEEPTTAPATEEPTTAPTTEEPTTAPVTEEPTTTGPASTDPTSATDAPASPDTPSTSDTPVSPSNPGAVQTGSASMAVIILLVLVSASGVLYFTRKRVK